MHVLLPVGVGDGRIFAAILGALVSSGCTSGLRLIGIDCAHQAIEQAHVAVREKTEEISTQHSHRVELRRQVRSSGSAVYAILSDTSCLCPFCAQDAQTLSLLQPLLNSHTLVVVKDVLQHWESAAVTHWLDAMLGERWAALYVSNDCKYLSKAGVRNLTERKASADGHRVLSPRYKDCPISWKDPDFAHCDLANPLWYGL